MVNTRSRQSADPEARRAAANPAKAPRAKRASHTSEPAPHARRSRSRQAEPTPVLVTRKTSTRKGQRKSQSDYEEEAARQQLLVESDWRKGKQLMSPVREEESTPIREREDEEEESARDIDREMAIAELPMLQTTAETLLKLLLHDKRDLTEIREELSKPDSVLSRRLDARKKTFEVPKMHFGKQKYISPNVIASVVKTDAYHPVLHEANLAVITAFFYTARQETDVLYVDLKALDLTFPEILGEHLTKENFPLALDLRTQTLVAGIVRDHEKDGFSAEALLNDVFYDGDSYRSFAGYIGVSSLIRERIDQLKLILTKSRENGDDIELGSLLEEYPWEKFVRRMVEYFRKLLADSGRRKMIDAAVENARAFDPSGPAEPGSENPPVSGQGDKALAEDKGKEKQEEHEPLSGLGAVRGFLGDKPAAGDYQQAIRRLGNEGNKENRPVPEPVVAGPSRRSFLDRQAGAKRVEWDSEAGHSQSPEQPQKRKRRAIEEEESGSEFELDTRVENEERRKRTRREPVPHSARNSAVSVRTSGVSARASARTTSTRFSGASDGPISGAPAYRNSDGHVGGGIIHRNELVPAHIGRQRSQSADSAESDDETCAGATALKRLDRINRRMRPRHLGGQQGRSPWTDEQTQTLIDMIGKYGPNWSFIAQQRHANLRGRTNVNLKDKARNIKIQYLRNNSRLPAGFRGVTISEKDRLQLMEKYDVHAAALEEECPDPGDEKYDVEDEDDEEREVISEHDEEEEQRQ